MRRIRRFAAIIMGLLTIQSSIASDAAACSMESAPASGMAMRGHMGRRIRGELRAPDGASTVPPAHDMASPRSSCRHTPQPHRSHCDLPCVPDGCNPGAHCTSAPLDRKVASLPTPFRSAEPPASGRIHALRSVSFAPEPPPPRA